jgi:hypothetical protein
LKLVKCVIRRTCLGEGVGVALGMRPVLTVVVLAFIVLLAAICHLLNVVFCLPFATRGVARGRML